MTLPIVFLSDFGYRNEWVGICHAVINKIAPESQVIDLSHGVPPLDVRAGALLLSDSLSFLRHDAVVLAVVDPSVATRLPARSASVRNRSRSAGRTASTSRNSKYGMVSD